MFLAMHNHIFGKNRCNQENKEEAILNSSTFQYLEIERLEKRCLSC